MTDDVPMIPYLWSSAITITSPSVLDYTFDQFSGTISLCHIATNNEINFLGS